MARRKPPPVQIRQLRKRYGGRYVLNGLDFELKKGGLYGLIGSNGAGKTTTLRALLGLVSYQGDIEIFGLDPLKHRTKLMHRIAYISDVASLPLFLTIRQLIDFLAGVHPNFSSQSAQSLLKELDLNLGKKLSTLSKGQRTQVHLALTLAIDYDFLVLDEPTIGLDIVVRKAFYRKIQRDIAGSDKIALITTHQVDEVEFMLTHALFLKTGTLLLNSEISQIGKKYWQLECDILEKPSAQSLKPLYGFEQGGKYRALYDNRSRNKAAKIGTLSQPTLSDIFVALMGPKDKKTEAKSPLFSSNKAPNAL